MSEITSCFKCEKLLKEENELKNKGPSIYPLYDGLRFRSTGNYGSSIFDPIQDNGFIEIWICDDCVLKNKNQVLRVKDINTKTDCNSSIFEPERELL